MTLSKTKNCKTLKGDAKIMPLQFETKRDGVINPQNYTLSQERNFDPLEKL